MNAQWTRWRVVSAAIAICLFVVAINFFISAAKFKRRFIEWQNAKPVTAAVDLSQPGEITLPFHQTCSSSHNEVVLLRVSEKARQAKTFVQLLDGLKARL